MPRINLRLKNSSYSITVGCHIEDKLLVYLRQQLGKRRLFVLYDANFFALYGTTLSRLLGRLKGATELVLPSGEKTKSANELGRIHDFLLEQKISRSDFVLAVGGGVTSDLAGFAAATVLRGVKWGVIPTTLLGMIDAAIGGKTGINHSRGKNLIGALWQPEFVWCDTWYLNTLPEREMVSGTGELLKYAGLIGRPMMEMVARYLNNGTLIDEKKVGPLIARCAKYKAEIVRQDERESGKRMVLNLGHTFAHGIENSLGYGKLRHGEAVILGLLAATELSKLHGSRNVKSLDRYAELVKIGVQLVPKGKLSPDKIMAAMSLDKKRIGRKLHFVLLDRPGRPIIVEAPPDRDVKKSILTMLDYYEKHGGQRA